MPNSLIINFKILNGLSLSQMIFAPLLERCSEFNNPTCLQKEHSIHWNRI